MFPVNNDDMQLYEDAYNHHHHHHHHGHHDNHVGATSAPGAAQEKKISQSKAHSTPQSILHSSCFGSLYKIKLIDGHWKHDHDNQSINLMDMTNYHDYKL